MYKINVTASFPGAHLLKHYDGACQNLHGHNWKVRVQLITSKVDEVGMAIDFKIVKDHLNALIEQFDHKFLNDIHYFSEQNPTSENIARVIYEQLQKTLDNNSINVNEVEIWESDFTSVIYSK